MSKSIQDKSNFFKPKVINLNRIAKQETLRSVEEDIDAQIQLIQPHKRFVYGLVPIYSLLMVSLFLFSFGDIAQRNLSNQELFYGRIKGAAGLVTIGTLGINAYLEWFYEKHLLKNLNNVLYIVKKAQINIK